MADTIVWYNTGLPDMVIDQIISDCKYYMDPLKQSKVGMLNETAPENIRKSEVSWIPSTSWIGGFIYSYVLKANRDNFKYDIEDVEYDAIQYTHYGLDGHYRWHTDTSLETWSKGNNGNNNNRKQNAKTTTPAATLAISTTSSIFNGLANPAAI